MSSINIVVCAEKTEYKVAVKNKIVNDELSIIGYADFQPESKMRIQGFVPDVVVFVLDSDEITPEFLTFVEDINLGSFGCSAIIMTDNVTVDLVNNAAQSGIRRVMNVNIGNEEFLNTVKSIVGNEKKFGKCVIQPKRFVTVGKEVALFTNTLHPSEGTVPVIIKFFVERCPLADFHQSDVCNQQLKLIFSQLVYLFMIRLGTVEIHIHESTEPQIIGSFRFSRLI